jgi:hypothetical protein
MLMVLRFAVSHFNLSRVTTPTQKLSLKVPLANKRTSLCYIMDK